MIYVEDYIDVINSLPGSLQELISQLREYDSCVCHIHEALMEEMDYFCQHVLELDMKEKESRLNSMNQKFIECNKINEEKALIAMAANELVQFHVKCANEDFILIKEELEGGGENGPENPKRKTDISDTNPSGSFPSALSSPNKRKRKDEFEKPDPKPAPARSVTHCMPTSAASLPSSSTSSKNSRALINRKHPPTRSQMKPYTDLPSNFFPAVESSENVAPGKKAVLLPPTTHVMPTVPEEINSESWKHGLDSKPNRRLKEASDSLDIKKSKAPPSNGVKEEVGLEKPWRSTRTFKEEDANIPSWSIMKQDESSLETKNEDLKTDDVLSGQVPELKTSEKTQLIKYNDSEQPKQVKLTLEGREIEDGEEEEVLGEDEEEEEVYCYCKRGAEAGDMVGCDKEGCQYEWFHLKCVNLKMAPPEGVQWICPECTDRQNDKPKRVSRRNQI
ncbi:hypothetical protein HMI54_001024 [Coelomomyces lativittatus]|nr:hypothetical protein HMI56_006767 [Coelomomyces lativittatus]KAJ1517663.1 hypothetical protein HMI55_006373 [Coelomomyces lativittatus]KAJ1518373.1 hypothetical protein HMI54_001024 [Coelomomyces lativittatus]